MKLYKTTQKHACVGQCEIKRSERCVNANWMTRCQNAPARIVISAIISVSVPFSQLAGNSFCLKMKGKGMVYVENAERSTEW